MRGHGRRWMAERDQSAPLPQGAMVDGTTTTLALAQGGYYLLSGIWPLASIGTFQWVTGPKTDLWLVRTVGALVAVIGATLGCAGLRRAVTPEVRLLAVGSALGLATIELVHVARRRIAPVYLLDVGLELALAVGWLASGRLDALSQRGDPPGRASPWDGLSAHLKPRHDR